MPAHRTSHTQQGTPHPGFRQTRADHRQGQPAAQGLGAALPAADCIAWAWMLEGTRSTCRMPPFSPWFLLCAHRERGPGSPTPVSLPLPHWGCGVGPAVRCCPQRRLTVTTTARIFLRLSQAEQRVKKSWGISLQAWKGLRKRKRAWI